MKYLTGSLLILAALDVSVAPGAAADFITRGRPDLVRVDTGNWVERKGHFGCSEKDGRLVLGQLVGRGDFHFRAVMKLGPRAVNVASVTLNEISELRLVTDTRTTATRTTGTRSARTAEVSCNGYFFGARTRKIELAGKGIRPQVPFRVEIVRRGDVVTLLLDGLKLTETVYENDREFGKIGFVVRRGSLAIREAKLLSGATSPLESWVHPLKVRHELPGEQVDVFSRGQGGYHTYRIPALVKTSSGTLLAFCEGRRNSAADHGDIDILVRRSRDRGRTWGDPCVVHHEDGGITIGNPVPVLDRDTGKVWLAFCRDNRRVFVTSSVDEGVTWTVPREITDTAKVPGWGGWYATGPGHGIQLRSGRLIVPANHGEMHPQRITPREKGRTAVNTVYSDDHGATWKAGTAAAAGTNEVTMAERSDGTVYMNARSYSGPGRRAYAVSDDGGVSWGPVRHDPVLVEPVCQGSVLGSSDPDGKPLFLFSNPASVRRERMTVRLSMDEGRTWPVSRVLYEGSSAYSDLVDLGDGWIGCLYERDGYNHLTFARLPLSWISGR